LTIAFVPKRAEKVHDAFDRVVELAFTSQLCAIAKERLERATLPVLREPDLQVIETSFGARVLDAKPHARGLPPDGALEFRWEPASMQVVDASRWDLG
jgi:hypothetical protein